MAAKRWMERETWVAGAVGFEPTNARIKTWCLGPLGDAPTWICWPFPESRNARCRGDAARTRNHPGPKPCWQLRLHRGCRRLRIKPHETATAGAGQAGLAVLRERREHPVNPGFEATQHRLEGIAERGSGNEVHYCRRGCIPRQIRGLEQFASRHGDARVHDQVPGRRQVQRDQFFTDAFGPGIAAAHEHRDIRAQLQAQAGQGQLVEPGAPEVIERHQRRGRVRGAATEAAARSESPFRRRCRHHSGVFVAFCSSLAAITTMSSAASTAVVGSADPMDGAIAADPQRDGIAPVQQLEHRLQR